MQPIIQNRDELREYNLGTIVEADSAVFIEK